MCGDELLLTSIYQIICFGIDGKGTDKVYGDLVYKTRECVDCGNLSVTMTEALGLVIAVEVFIEYPSFFVRLKCCY